MVHPLQSSQWGPQAWRAKGQRLSTKPPWGCWCVLEKPLDQGTGAGSGDVETMEGCGWIQTEPPPGLPLPSPSLTTGDRRTP